MVTKRESGDPLSKDGGLPPKGPLRPLLDKLGVRPGSRVALVNLDDPGFVKQLRERTQDVVLGKPRSKVDLVFMGADNSADLRRLNQVKSWIEPDGAVWVVRPKGGRSALREAGARGGDDRRAPRRQPVRQAALCRGLARGA